MFHQCGRSTAKSTVYLDQGNACENNGLATLRAMFNSEIGVVKCLPDNCSKLFSLLAFASETVRHQLQEGELDNCHPSISSFPFLNNPACVSPGHFQIVMICFLQYLLIRS